MTPITEQSLIDNGYEKQVFFYQVGGGEDEDDREIFVKDGIAVTFESTTKSWHARKMSEISYEGGFNTDFAVTLRYIEEIIEVA
jgi:hypothetical protein